MDRRDYRDDRRASRINDTRRITDYAPAAIVINELKTSSKLETATAIKDKISFSDSNLFIKLSSILLRSLILQITFKKLFDTFLLFI